MQEIEILGRGGQGAVTTAYILAEAIFLEGKFSQAFPFFGVERQGSPVFGYVRISDKNSFPIQHVYKPEISVVFEKSLIKLAKGKRLISSPKTVDAQKIAIETIGKPVFGTVLLGALVKSTKVCKPKSVEKAIKKMFDCKETADKNIKAFRRGYDETTN